MSSNIVLPDLISYGDSLPVLPDSTTAISLSNQPSNGSVFLPNSQIYIDLVSRGFLVPDSMYLSYTYTLTSDVSAQMIGVPAVTPINRVDVQFGSQIVDTIQSYNIFYNMISNLQLDVAQKYGMQSAFNYNNSTTTPAISNLDGRLCRQNETGSCAFPLITMLSNAEKLIPLAFMPQCRLILTLENISNMFTSAVVPTGFSISNVNLRYKIIDFGGQIESMLLSSADKLYIKTQSFGLASQTLAAQTSGSIALVFNMRYASCKAIFAINGNGADLSNRAFDSVDLTSGTGTYGFQVAGVNYPPQPLNMTTQKAGALLELRSAFGSVYDKTNSMSINSVEFGYNSTDASSSWFEPAKMYVGTSLEKLNSNSLLTGISTSSTPISYLITSGQSIGTRNSTVTLCVNYDALIEVDTLTRQVAVKQ